MHAIAFGIEAVDVGNALVALEILEISLELLRVGADGVDGLGHQHGAIVVSGAVGIGVHGEALLEAFRVVLSFVGSGQVGVDHAPDVLQVGRR
ncbi:hypothetical protein D9M72_529060 [compost metagenome]